MARVPAMCFQEEKKGRLLLSLVNTNMKVFVIMLKHHRGRCSLVVILALILFFFQFSSLKSYTIHKYEICPESLCSPPDFVRLKTLGSLLCLFQNYIC